MVIGPALLIIPDGAQPIRVAKPDITSIHLKTYFMGLPFVQVSVL
jgi:hypothetical protein